VWISHLRHTWCVPRWSHLSWFAPPNNIWWGVQLMKPSLCSYEVFCSLVLLSRP
jgi:hypothetical protein